MNKKQILLLGGGMLLPLFVLGAATVNPLVGKRASSGSDLPLRAERVTRTGVATQKSNVPVQNPVKVPAGNIQMLSQGKQMHKVPSLAPVKERPNNLTAYVPNKEIPGVYRLPMTYDDDFELLYGNEYFVSNYSAVEANGVFYTTEYVQDEYIGEVVMISGYDSKTWDPVMTLMGTPGCCGIDTAYDPVTGRVYGCFMNDDMTGTVFGYIDYAKSDLMVERVKIADLDKVLYGVAIDAEGKVYGITNNGDLYSVNKETGELTFIGETGLEDTYMTSATIDLRTGKMYYAVSADNFGAMYEVNPVTAESSFIFQFFDNEEIIGLYAAKPLVEEDAPAAVQNLSIAFDKDATKGTFSFTAPVTLYNGNPSSGELSYTIRVKRGDAPTEVLASGNTAFGENVSCEVDVVSDGICEFWIYVTNGVGDGKITKETMFVGHDIPVSPTVKTSYSDGRSTLSWNPVTVSVNGGYIDVDNIAYTVVRTTDGKVVADAIKETSFVDILGDVDELVEVRYEVTASDGVKSSEPTLSSPLIAGTVKLPYSQSFDDADSFSYLTCLDANEDEKTWAWSDMYGGAAKLAYAPRWASDDWLVLPGMKLEEGKSYLISFRPFSGDAYNEEMYEVKYGTAVDIESMTEEIIPPTKLQVKCDMAEMVEAYIVPSATRVYYIGFHGMSEKDRFNVYIDDISVSAGLTVGSPKAVSDFKVEAAMEGVCAATLSFKAPEETMNGEPLANLSKIEIIRDGSLIATIEHVAPGEEITFVDDKDLSIGTHEWTVMAYNGSEPSLAATASAHIGFDYARPVTNIKAVEGPEYGQVTVTWDPVTEDVRGNLLPAGAVTYTVYERHDLETPLAAGITETSLYSQMQLPEGVQQSFLQFMVIPVTDAGENYDGNMSMAIPVGKPFDCPYVESFPNRDASYPLGIMSDNNEIMRWGVYDSTSFRDPSGEYIQVYDNDGGMAVCFGLDPGCFADMLTPKIQLPEENPELSFYFYPMADTDVNELHVFVKCQEEEKEVGMVVMNTTGPSLQWNRVAMQLREYAGKVITLRFRGIVQSHTRMFMDHVSVARGADNDLAVTSINAPSSVRPGREFDVEVCIANYGAKKAENYTVDILCNGVEILSQKGTAIEPGEKTLVKVTTMLNALDDEENIYYAVVSLPDDEEGGNDISADAVVVLRNNPYPPVSGLQGVAGENGISLSWNEPDINDMSYEEYEENFETGEDWQFEFSGWTFIDRDGGVMGAFDMVQIPDMTPADTETNFFVFNCAGTNFPETWDAHSGTKYLACIYNYNEVQNDDWAISPRLFGKEQEISFYAKSYNYNYLEDFEVLYTTEDFDADNFDASKFISVGKKMQIESNWKKYTFQLPDGAKYFAIRCISNDAMMLMIDDVTYIPDAGADGIAHMGYNVYRDGERINSAFVEEASYFDPVAVGSDHTYHVTAVYDLGESVPTKIFVGGNSVEELLADGITVEILEGAIAINGAEGRRIVVSDMEGKVVFAGIGSERTVVPVSKGIYAISAEDDTRKVNVK